MLKELTAFQWTGRRIIPIEIGDALDPQKYPKSPLLPFIPADLLKINQPLEQGKIPNEVPPEVVRELRRGFQHVRQAQKRIRFLLGVCLVLLGLFSIAVWQAISANLQRKEADRQKHEAVKQEAKAKDQTKKTSEAASRASVSLARYSKESGKNAQALAQLGQALRLNPENEEASGLTAAMLTRLTWNVPLAGSMKHEDDVLSAQFSPNGQRVVTASADNTARLWDAASGNPIGEPMKHKKPVMLAQFSPDGQRVVTASWDKTARMWDAIMTDRDKREDILLLAELAEAIGGVTLKTVEQADNLKLLAPEQVRASRERIAVKFLGPSSKLTPLQRLMLWSVSDRRSRTISPLSQVTVSEWLENRIKEGTVESLEPRYSSILRMLASPHILAGVLPIMRSNKARIQTKLGAPKEKLNF